MTAPDVTLQVEVPVDGIFILGTSVLGGPDTLAAVGESGLEWVDVQCEATSITIRRGASRSGIGQSVQVGTITATFHNGIDPALEPQYRPGVGIRASSAAVALFTGTVADAAAAYGKTTGDVRATLTGRDAVAALANTTRQGAANAVTDHEPWTQRVGRILQSSPVPFEAPAAEPTAIVLWDVDGETDAPNWDNEGTGDGIVFVSDPTHRVLTGLTTGDRYELVTEWNQDVRRPTITVDAADSQTTNLGSPDDLGRELYSTTFTAEAASHTVTATGAFIVGLRRVTLAHRPFIPQAANIEHDTNLASHLDIATASANRAWCVAAAGIVRIPTPGAIAARLSDVHDPDDPLHICYIDVDARFDTANVVNDLALNNHGREAAESGYNATTTALGPYVNRESAATWGRRAATLETAIYAGDAYEYPDGPDRIAAGYLEQAATARVTIAAATVDVLTNALAAALDIGDRVAVDHRGATHAVEIVAVDHTITPRTWRATFTFKEA